MKKDATNDGNTVEIESDDQLTEDGDDSIDTSTGTWSIPLPKTRSPAHRHHTRRLVPLSNSNTSTPLLRPSRRPQQQQQEHHDRDSIDHFYDDNGRIPSTKRLFEDSSFLSFPKHTSTRTESTSQAHKASKPEGWAGWLFGFMYEDTYDESFCFDDEDGEGPNATVTKWNSLNMAIFASYTLTTAATALPVLLIPTIGQDSLQDESEKSAFSSRAASSAVFGIACGKFLNGQVGDFLGARRASSMYSMLLAASLMGLAASQSAASAITACFYVEFFQSVQWPCIIVLLGTHYSPPHHTAQYESGIFMTSIASRIGALLGIPIFSTLLRQSNWRLVCFIGAWIAAIGSSIMYLHVTDSPTRMDDPQNPLHPNLLQQVTKLDPIKHPKRFAVVSIKVFHSIITKNVIPSFKHVLTSGTFWVVALAHTGSSMVRTSERILGSYFYDTSFGSMSENRAGGLAIFLSLGTVLGLGIAGNLFAHRKERQRKWLVSRLYVITIAACYGLAILAIPRLRRFVDDPGLVLFFQVLCSLCLGFGISVMYSLIPGLVGSAFGRHRGSYIAYTDGIAFGISSIVWRIVASAVANGNPDGGGWAYGWAAVALLVILCGILMVEFMEHYFVRAPGRHNGTYETIMLA